MAPTGVFTHGHMVSLLIVGGLVTLRCLFILRYPIRKCRCLPGRMRAACPKCHGYGLRYRRGATAIHRFAWSVLLRRLMERRREAVADQLPERTPQP